jgi:hypothetical protein
MTAAAHPRTAGPLARFTALREHLAGLTDAEFAALNPATDLEKVPAATRRPSRPEMVANLKVVV